MLKLALGYLLLKVFINLFKFSAELTFNEKVSEVSSFASEIILLNSILSQLSMLTQLYLRNL